MSADGDLWLVRHGETEWSRDGRHTSVTDLPLTPRGEQAATALREQVAEAGFDQVLSSPRRRATSTAELVGFPDPDIEPDLVEWDYGDYEGITTVEIREQDPSWQLWTDGCPGGETPTAVSQRCDRVVQRVRASGGRVLAVGHGHALRALAVRWLDLPVETGSRLVLHTSTVSVLGYDRGTAVIERWNV